VGAAGTSEAQYYGTDATPLSGVPADVVVVDLDTRSVRFATGSFALMPDDVRTGIHRGCKAFATAILQTRMRRTSPNTAAHNAAAAAAALQAQASQQTASAAAAGAHAGHGATAAVAVAAAAAAAAAGGALACPAGGEGPRLPASPPAAALAHAPAAAGLATVLPPTSPLNPAVQALAPLATPALVAPVPTPADPAAPAATAVTTLRNVVLDAILTMFASYCLFWERSRAGSMVEPPRLDPTTVCTFVDVNAAVRRRPHKGTVGAPAHGHARTHGPLHAGTAPGPGTAAGPGPAAGAPQTSSASFGGPISSNAGVAASVAGAGAAAAADSAPVGSSAGAGEASARGSGLVRRGSDASRHSHGSGGAGTGRAVPPMWGCDGEGVNGVPLVMTTAPGGLGAAGTPHPSDAAAVVAAGGLSSLAAAAASALPVLPVHSEFDLVPVPGTGGRRVHADPGDAEVALADNVPVSMHAGSDWYLLLDYDLPAFLDNVKPTARAFVGVVARTALFRHFLAVRHRLRGLPVCMYLFDQWAALKVHNRWTDKLAPRRQAQLGAPLLFARVDGRFHRRFCELPANAANRILVHHEQAVQPALAPKHDRTLIPMVCRVSYPIPVAPQAAARAASFPFSLSAVVTPEVVLLIAELARREQATMALRARRISQAYQSSSSAGGPGSVHASLTLGAVGSRRARHPLLSHAGAGADDQGAGPVGVVSVSSARHTGANGGAGAGGVWDPVAAAVAEGNSGAARLLGEGDSLEDLVVTAAATIRGPGSPGAALLAGEGEAARERVAMAAVAAAGVLLAATAAGAGLTHRPAWPSSGGLGPTTGVLAAAAGSAAAALTSLQQGLGVWPLTMTQLIAAIHSWERGFLFKADSAAVRHEWVKALEARLMHPDLITRYRQFM
jgi:hypothetical protein